MPLLYVMIYLESETFRQQLHPWPSTDLVRMPPEIKQKWICSHQFDLLSFQPIIGRTSDSWRFEIFIWAHNFNPTRRRTYFSARFMSLECFRDVWTMCFSDCHAIWCKSETLYWFGVHNVAVTWFGIRSISSGNSFIQIRGDVWVERHLHRIHDQSVNHEYVLQLVSYTRFCEYSCSYRLNKYTQKHILHYFIAETKRCLAFFMVWSRTQRALILTGNLCYSPRKDSIQKSIDL